MTPQQRTNKRGQHNYFKFLIIKFIKIQGFLEPLSVPLLYL